MFPDKVLVLDCKRRERERERENGRNRRGRNLGGKESCCKRSPCSPILLNSDDIVLSFQVSCDTRSNRVHSAVIKILLTLNTASKKN